MYFAAPELLRALLINKLMTSSWMQILFTQLLRITEHPAKTIEKSDRPLLRGTKLLILCVRLSISR